MDSLKIGIDFGGVLSIHDNKSDAEHKNVSIDMPYALESLKILEKDYKLYLISFCGKNRAIETKNSLENISNLFQGIFFVKNKDYKRELCDFFGCDFMIDDRKDVLDHIKMTNKEIITIHFGVTNSKDHIPAKDWLSVIENIKKINHTKCKRNKNIDIKKFIHLF